MGIDEAITVSEYDDLWPELYEQEASILKNVFGERALEIQHFGSTSVPGMIAKPIIDILIGVLYMDLDKLIIKELSQMAYEEFGEAGVPGRLYFRKRKVHAFNLAIVKRNGEQWNNNILIRDFLRLNPESAKEYSERKLEAVSKGLITLLSYSDEKAEYVYNLLQKAKRSFN